MEQSSCAAQQLAIVIPAWKPTFFLETLRSLAAQQDKCFSVYVGDDASPSDQIKRLVDAFSQEIPSMHYTRFSRNLGAKDLVGQWERCIALTHGEPWIMLFSDDDILPPDAVRRFKQVLSQNSVSKLFRFPLKSIDEQGQDILVPEPFHSIKTSAEDFLLSYMSGKRISAISEYIFSRDLFDAFKMVHFPLAWCADIATWYLYASHCGGITNISGEPVSWRNANAVNISNTSGKETLKMDALISFLAWLNTHWRNEQGFRFSSALYKYIKTNLLISFQNKYTKEAIQRLLRVTQPLSLLTAVRIWYRFIFHRQYIPSSHENPHRPSADTLSA